MSKKSKTTEFESSYEVVPTEEDPGLRALQDLGIESLGNIGDPVRRVDYSSETKFGIDWTSYLANRYKYFIDIYSITLQKSIRFKAFLTQFQDQFDTGYDDEFLGADTEPHKRMTSMVRKISLGWDLVAVDTADAKNNLQRISSLVQMMYPPKLKVQDPVTKVSQWLSVTGGQPAFRIRLFNLIGNSEFGHGAASDSGLLGYIDNLSYDFQINSGFFREKEHVYPQFIKLSCRPFR